MLIISISIQLYYFSEKNVSDVSVLIKKEVLYNIKSIRTCINNVIVIRVYNSEVWWNKIKKYSLVSTDGTHDMGTQGLYTGSAAWAAGYRWECVLVGGYSGAGVGDLLLRTVTVIGGLVAILVIWNISLFTYRITVKPKI